MRYFLLIITCLLIKFPGFAQADSIAETGVSGETISNAPAQAKAIVIDLSNPADVELTLKKIHTFRYLESVVLEGDTDESTLQKIIYRLSVLKSLSALTLRDNGIEKIPDNIKNIKTLSSVSIEGNPELDYNDLCTKLSALPITELQLTDNNLKKTPPVFSSIKSLKKISISGSDQLNYDNLVDELAKLPGLTGLSIPVNYITELPKNITKLKSLQLLDVSNNILTDLPSEVSSLKAINNLSIQGNLLLNPVKDLEKFKGNDIKYLSLDKEITGDDVEQIKKMFPNAEISYPVSEKEEEPATPGPAKKEISPKKEKLSGELKVKKESTILSAAYLSYPGLFQGLQYNFDTLSFEERFMDLRYSNVFQKVNNGWNGGFVYLTKPRLWHYNYKRRHEKWFYMLESTGLNNYPELRSFASMHWIYEGPLSKRKFRKTYLRRWNDIRIEYEKNNSLFTIKVKSDTGFVSFNAYPVVSGLPIEKSRLAYNRSFLMYQKMLARRSQSFKRDLTREKKKYDANFKKLQAYAWKELQLRMSDEEKLMSHDEWLAYYDQIIGNEQLALKNSALNKGFIQRSLALNYYFNRSAQSLSTVNGPASNANDYINKTVNIDFVDTSGTLKLPVVNIIILDNKNRRYTEMPGSLGLSPNTMVLKPYSSISMIVELRNGDFGLVTGTEIDSHLLEVNKTYSLKTIVVDKNLGTIGDLLKGSGIK